MHLLEWRSTGLRSYVIELGKQMVLRRDRLVLTVILGSETKQERPEIERNGRRVSLLGVGLEREWDANILHQTDQLCSYCKHYL